MSDKNVEDYLTDGIHGTRLPKQAERDYFLGTLRERIILALKTGDVMRDKGLNELDAAMVKYPDGELIFNGQIASKFQAEEKKLAQKHDINYTIITNNDNNTDIGAIFALDRAIDKQKIYLEEIKETKSETNEVEQDTSKDKSFLSRLKNWFS